MRAAMGAPPLEAVIYSTRDGLGVKRAPLDPCDCARDNDASGYELFTVAADNPDANLRGSSAVARRPRDADLHRENAQQTKRVGGGGFGSGGEVAASQGDFVSRVWTRLRRRETPNRWYSAIYSGSTAAPEWSIVATHVEIAVTLSSQCSFSRCTEAADVVDS